MATTTKTTAKKKCIGLKSSLYNPQIKGCGRNLTINEKNFKVVFRSKDGFGNFCNRCKDEWQPAIDEFKASRNTDDKAKLKKTNKDNTKARSKKRTKARAKTNGKTNGMRQKAQETLPEQTPDTDKPDSFPETFNELELVKPLAYPHADIDDRITVDKFNSERFRTELPNLNGLSKYDENIITFLHSILIQGDDENWADKNEVQRDICNRFRSKQGATLKGFTMRLNRDGLVELKQEKVGFDKIRNGPILITSHYKLSTFGIEWYNESTKDGLPAPMIPDELKVRKRIYDKKKTGFEVDKIKDDENMNMINNAFVDAENEEIGKAAMIQFLKDYMSVYNMTAIALSQKLGGAQHVVSRATCQDALPKKFYDKIKNLMLLNPNINRPLFGANPEDKPEDKSTESTDEFMMPEDADFNSGQPPAIPAPAPANFQETLEQKIVLADSIIKGEPQGYSKVLIKQISKAKKALKKANAIAFEAKLESELIEAKIAFLKDKYNNL